MAYLAYLTFDQMKVVEQPLCSGGDRLAATHVPGQDVIRVTERARVVGQSAEQPRGTTPRVSGEGKSGRQRPGALFQALDAEEFAVQGAGVEADQ